MRAQPQQRAAGSGAGGVTFSEVAIAKLAGHAARTTYGVVDLRSAPLRRVADLFRGPLTEGVEVQLDGDSARIRLHVVMERGVNLAQVTAILQEQVSYQIEHATRLKVAEVDVRVEDLRE
jgi:uncharacterized alkaline shock family protein YloU